MEPVANSWQESFSLGLTYSVAQISSYIPRIIAAFFVLIVGLLLSRALRKIVIKTLEAVRVPKAVEKTPLELFLSNAELGHKMEDGIAGVLYWLALFLTLHSTVSVLGLTPLSNIFQQILIYIPHIFSALFIFILGVLLAGVVETLVKGALKGLDTHSARLFAKVASYLVVTIASLAAIAELGIASQFIMILFVGVVFTLSLGGGLALGLGGRETVERILNNWQKRDEDESVAPTTTKSKK
jgi:hypothetical protein